MPIIQSDRPTLALPFDVLLASGGVPQDLVTVPAGFEGTSILMDVSAQNCRVAFDQTAGPSGLRLTNGSRYQGDGLSIRTRVSFVGDPGGRPRVTGVLWCRQR